MANIDRFVRGSKIADNAQAVRVVENVLDFSLLNVTTNDVVYAIEVEPGTVVLAAGFRVVELGNAGITGQLGDGTAADTYIGATALSSASNVASAKTTPTYYAAKNNIALKVSGTLDTGKVVVWAVMANVIGNI